MSSETKIPDAASRARALDPTGSFIVQAPAGSGKTELLTQRFLALLNVVHDPEEIIALTFTNKAVGEMRGRIIDALRAASSEPMPEAAHARKTWKLAREAVARSARRGWCLPENPSRLKIQTIDALSSSLMRRLPWLSRSGALPKIAEDPEDLYERAAREALREIEEEVTCSDSIALILEHMDNNLERTVELVVKMLGKRDQWLRHLVPEIDRGEIEEGILSLVGDHLNLLDRLISTEDVAVLDRLARYALSNLDASQERRPLTGYVEASDGPLSNRLARWRAFADLLLTSSGTFRRQFNARIGFPPASAATNAAEKEQLKQWKDRAKHFAAALGDSRQFGEELAAVKILPDPRLSDEDWKLISATCELLVRAAGHLALVFREAGAVDYTEVALRAREAIGSSDAPTDLALVLDAKITHILIDEFQDTSVSQYELVRTLIAGWEEEDGRTLFVVGDPMQSIYRFREAEVGHYLDARKHGIGSVRLEPLQLESNFRSIPALVAWINEAFPQVMPETNDVLQGAVSFSPSVAARIDDRRAGSLGVEIHPFIGRSQRPEAEKVVSLVEEIRSRHPNETTAILVRSRSHLEQIVPALRRAGISFQAVELESLADNSAVKDVHSLARAMIDRADRIAWMSVLRAPWCGMKLSEIDMLVAGDHDIEVAQLLCDDSATEKLSTDSLRRGRLVLDVIDRATALRGARNLRDIVEAAWLELGGPACVCSEADLDNVAVYLDLLTALGGASAGGDLSQVHRSMSRLYARPDADADASLQIMSIHKAKGLEFDHVILPGMNRKPNADDNPLLAWLEHRRSEEDRRDLLVAPLASSRSDNQLYRFLLRSRKRAAEHETGRLLYVATTRAKKTLHLLGTIKSDKAGAVSATSGSLLSLLWHAVESEYEKAAAVAQDSTLDVDADRGDQISNWRISSDWEAPKMEDGLVFRKEEDDFEEEGLISPSFSWVREMTRHTGTLVHEILHRIADEGLERWTAERVGGLRQWIVRRLIGLGVAEDNVERGRAQVQEAVNAMLDDSRGRWILESSHTDAASELALSGYDEGAFRHIVIDRTFIDADGRRWVVDYKTSVHEGAGLDEFLEAEKKRYRAQLERYGRMVARWERTPLTDEPVEPAVVHLGLYFPLLRSWKEWELAVE